MSKKRPSQQIGMEVSFALYSAVGRMTKMHKPFLEPLGLTFPQYLVLLELFKGSPRTVGDLGNRLAMDTGTITPLLKRMQGNGTLTRTRDPKDERRVLVELTPHGASLREQVLGVSDKIKAACQLDEQGMIDLRDTLNNFSQPLNE
ncbi:MAG: MarR family transcriptional regulator [Devosia sp.]|jgi:DNA-binding MarR family transcriptional regulator|nr:MarR family transcriptional regulator [Devosia sp.]